MDTPTYTIRKLTRKDRCVLTDLLTTFVQKTDQESLLSMVPSEKNEGVESSNGNADMVRSTLELLTDMVKYISVEITPWFADLISVSVEEFDNLPFDIEVEIIDQLVTSKGFVAFFLKVSRLRNKIKDLVIL